jgi:hypothetical protein
MKIPQLKCKNYQKEIVKTREKDAVSRPYYCLYNATGGRLSKIKKKGLLLKQNKEKRIIIEVR